MPKQHFDLPASLQKKVDRLTDALRKDGDNAIGFDHPTDMQDRTRDLEPFLGGQGEMPVSVLQSLEDSWGPYEVAADPNLQVGFGDLQQ